MTGAPVYKIVCSVALLVMGLALLAVRVDREYINLQPAEGESASVVLTAGHTFQQSFPATRPNISRVSLFIRSAAVDLRADNIQITVATGDTVEQRLLPTSLIDQEGATSVRFHPPLPTRTGQIVTITVSVPHTLDGMLRVQTRPLDNTFDPGTVTFSIDGKPQTSPLAYMVHFRSTPALAVQLGGLALLAALLIWLPSVSLYVLGVSALFLAPAFQLGSWPLVEFAFTAIALAGMTAYLRQVGLELTPALVGGHAFAFSTWYILHAQAGHSFYVIAAALPLIFMLAHQPLTQPSRRQKQLLATISLLVLLALTQIPGITFASALDATASPRDIFLDPVQNAAAVKVLSPSGQALAWSHFGSYLGPINSLLAAIGLIYVAKRHRAIVACGLIGALLALTPLHRPAAALLPIPSQHLIILTTLALAFCAGFGLSLLRRFLEPYPHSRVIIVPLVTNLLALLALLDLWHVAAGVLEYPLLR